MFRAKLQHTAGAEAIPSTTLSSQLQVKKESLIPIIHHKLVRDRIPEIIQSDGKTCFHHQAADQELRDAIGDKVIEEAQEFLEAWQCADDKDILKESADILEILLAGLEQHGLGLDDLLAARASRAEKRGAFTQGIILESVNGPAPSNSPPDHPRFLSTRNDRGAMLQTIAGELEQCDSVLLASAFYAPAQNNILVSGLSRLVDQGGSAKVLLSTMNNMNRPEHLEHLQRAVPGVEVRVFHPPTLSFEKDPPPFHAKMHLFSRRNGTNALLIGSSNLTPGGMSGNVEWNYHTSQDVNQMHNGRTPFQEALEEFMDCWDNLAVPVSEKFLRAYRTRWREPNDLIEHKTNGYGQENKQVEPNPAQSEALQSLQALRTRGVTRAAVIAATGLGKTFLAAFDFLQTGHHRVLFIVHRETILRKAMETFSKVFKGAKSFSLLGNGNGFDENTHGCFAMIQTLARPKTLENIPPNHFDYMVIDEFHRGEAETYKRVLEHFKPKFFLGLTATPERMDGRNVLRFCGHHVAYEVRVMQAIDRGWLVPFQYFAIHDATDYSEITWKRTDYDETELTRALSNDTRTALVANNLRRFLPSTGKIKALAFCSSVAHARYTAEQLQAGHGIMTLSLTGDSSTDDRHRAIERLRNEGDPLQVICTVDLFNEGVDIPEITHLLLLRPTLSFTVFLQQLGRGLRLAPGKEFVVVLDFVGNFKKSYVAPLALQGFTSIHQYHNHLKNRKSGQGLKPPKECIISPDLKVQRIWDNQIRSIIERMPLKDRLKALYRDIRTDLGAPPTLMDFINSPYIEDPHVFLKEFGGWLRTKKECGEGDLSSFEMELLDGPGEKFLLHLELDLKPSKSYKMVVLDSLLNLPTPGGWRVEYIAQKFHQYFLDHPDQMQDYGELYKNSDPQNFPKSKVISKLKNMPLKFLSNTSTDWFTLDSKKNEFWIKEEIRDLWTRSDFQALVRDRVNFALARYFENKTHKA